MTTKKIVIKFLFIFYFSLYFLFCTSLFASVSVTKLTGSLDYSSLVYYAQASENYYFFYWIPNNRGDYDANDYVEFTNFGFTETSAPTSVVLEWEWHIEGSGATGSYELKFEVWEADTSTWHNEIGLIISGTDGQYTRNIFSYIDTINDINNIKVRHLGYISGTGSYGTHTDYLRINVNSGTTVKTIGGTISKNVTTLQYSDNVWRAWLAKISSVYTENQYGEYLNFEFSMPAGSVMGSVVINYEWQWDTLTQGGNLQAAKLEVYEADCGPITNQACWHNEDMSLPAKATDGTETDEVASYIDTPNDVNNIRIRFLGDATPGNPILGVRSDYVAIKAKRKIIASDIAVYGPAAATFYASDTDKLILDFKVPDNDGVSDTLNSLYIKNDGSAVNTTDILRLELWQDGASQGWNGDETEIGDFIWDVAQARWATTGLLISIPVDGKRLFVTADISSNPTNGRTIKAKIPINGITVASGFGGPTDAEAINSNTQTIDGMVASQITNNNAPATSIYPDSTNNLIMDFTIPLNGTATETLTGLRIQNTAGTAVNSTDVFAIKAWAESGATPGFQSAQDTNLGTLTWSAGCSCWQKTDISHSYSTARRIYITADISSSAIDARTIQANIKQGSSNSDAGTVVASDNDGPINAVLTNVNAQTINGMIASQITNTGAASDTFYANDTSKPIMNFVIPANGGTADTINTLRIKNQGTAVDTTDISAVKFWADNGDNIFNAGTDTNLGTAAWSAVNSWWELAGLSQTTGTSGKRIFATANISSSPTAGRTCQFYIPYDAASTNAGIQVASGNDGPLDANVTNSNIQTIKEKLNIEWTNLALSSACKGGFDFEVMKLKLTSTSGVITLTDLKLDLSGTAEDSHITAVKLWRDENGNSIIDSGIDTQLSTTKIFSGKTLTFNSINQNVSTSMINLLIGYDISGSIPDGITAGSYIGNTGYFTVSDPTNEDKDGTNLPAQSHNTTFGTAVIDVTGTNVAPSQVDLGETDAEMLKLKLLASCEPATVASIRVDRAGTGSDSDVSGVKLYNDLDGDGVIEGGETQVGTTQTFSSGYCTFAGLSYSVTNATYSYIIISFDIDASAEAGMTVGASLDNHPTYISLVEVGGSTTFINPPIDSSNASIGQTLSVSGVDKAPSTIQVGESDVEMLWLTLTSSEGTIQVTSVTIDRTGTGINADLTNTKLYDDTNDNGIVDGGDVVLSTKVFTSASVTFSGLTYNVTNGTPEHLLIVYNISSSATSGNTVGASINNKTYIAVGGGAKVESFGTISSTNSQIRNTLTVTGTDKASLRTDCTKGQTNIVFEQLTLTSSAGLITVSTVKVDRGGSGVDGDLSAARLYHDVNNNGNLDVGDVQISATKTLSLGTLTFDNCSFNVSAGTTENLLIVYDISSSAVVLNTIGVSLANNTYITATQSGATINFTTSPISSTNLTIKNPATLTASFNAITSPVNTNQQFDVILQISNSTNSSKANNVVPNPIDLTKIYTGGAQVTKVSGPSPASATISGGDYQNYSYVFRADIAGTVQFEANATGTESNLGTTVQSSSVQSNVVTINIQVSPLWEFSDSGTTQAFYGGGTLEWECPSVNAVTTIYIGNNNNKLYAVKVGDGSKRWSYTVSNAIESTPYIDYETCIIYFGDNGGNFYAVRDTASGPSLVWSASLSPGSAIKTSALFWTISTEDRIYIASTNGYLYCRRASDGGSCTSWPIGDVNVGSAISSTPAISQNNMIWVTTEGGTIRQYDANNGNLGTNYAGYGKFTAPIFGYNENTSSPTYLFLGDWNKNFYKIDTSKPAGSQNIWTFSPVSPVAASYFVGGGWYDMGYTWGGTGTTYTGNDNKCLYAINVNGTQKWKYPSGSNILASPIKTMPIYWEGYVYFGADDYKFYALKDNGTSGDLVAGWPYQSGGMFRGSPTVDITTNRIIIGSTDYKLYAFPLLQ